MRVDEKEETTMTAGINKKFLEDKRRFAAWRRHRKKRGPVPPELWQRALAHVGDLGLNRVSREFRLNYTQLKRKAQQGHQPLPGKDRGAAAFVELAWPGAAAPGSAPLAPLRLVLERTDGGRLCVEGLPAEGAWLPGLVESFWRS
jgi:hypothetical protein